MISLKNLREDRQAELTDKPFFDLVNCTPIQIIGTYHDIDDKVIVWDINTVRITLNKIYTNKSGKDYFVHLGRRYYIENFARL